MHFMTDIIYKTDTVAFAVTYPTLFSALHMYNPSSSFVSVGNNNQLVVSSAPGPLRDWTATRVLLPVEKIKIRELIEYPSSEKMPHI